MFGIKRNVHVHGSALFGMHFGTESGFDFWKSNKGDSCPSAFSLRFKKAPAVSGNGASHCGGKGLG